MYMYMNDILIKSSIFPKYSAYLPKSLLLALAAHQLQSPDSLGKEY